MCTIFYEAKYIETHIDNKVPNIEYPIFIYDAWIILMIPSLSVGWQDSNVDLWAISCNIKDTESEGTGQKSSDDQVSYF